MPAPIAASTVAARARALVGRGAAVGGLWRAAQEKERAATVIGHREIGRSGGKRFLDRKGLSSTMKDFENYN